VFEGEEDNLAVLYGPTTDGVRMVLLSSIVACVVLCVVGSIMHAVLVSVCIMSLFKMRVLLCCSLFYFKK
jgi:hypothetical protein